MRRINDWAKRLVLCFLSFVMVFSMASETVFAADKEMEIIKAEKLMWDYIIDKDDVTGYDVEFPSSAGDPYLLDENGETTIKFWLMKQNRSGYLKNMYVILGRYDESGEAHLKTDKAPGSQDGFYLSDANGKVEISLSREDLPNVTNGIKRNGVLEDKQSYQIRVQKYGEGGGYWVIGTAYYLDVDVIGRYHKYYGEQASPSKQYWNSEYPKGHSWGTVVYDYWKGHEDKKQPILDMKLVPATFELEKNKSFDLTNQDDLRQLVVSYTELQGKQRAEISNLIPSEKVHPVELKDVLQRNSSEHYIIYEALNVTPIGKTPALKPNQTVLTEPGEYKIQLRGFFNGKQSNERTNRYVTKETTIKIPFPDVIPEKDKNGNLNRWPANYVPVTFVSDGHGTLTGMTKYYVNPDEVVDLTSQANAITKTPNVGYKASGKWDPEQLKKKFDSESEFTFHFEAYDDVIPAKPGVTKPNDYSTVTFTTDGHGTLTGEKVYYVNPKKSVDLNEKANALTKTPNVGYKKSGTWAPAIQPGTFTKDQVFTFQFDAYADVIKVDPNETKPNGYVTVQVIPTDKATDKTIKSYWVKQNTQVTLPVSEPVGKEEIGADNLTHTYHFTGWTVTKGVVASWEKPSSGTTQIAGKFSLDTDITAQYSVSIDPLPVPKKNVESAVGSTLKPEDLIANLPGSGEGSLPEGTTVAIDGTPDLSKAGTTTVKVVVTYPKGNTITVSVPVKVVAGKPTVTPVYTYMGRYPTPEDYRKAITPAKGAEIRSIGITENPDVSKPYTLDSPAIGKVVVHYKDGSVHYLPVSVVVYDNVIKANPDGSIPDGTPSNYVKVTMDPTNDAKDPTKQIFYVNPDVAVTLTVTDPVGKTGFEFGSWEKDVSRPTKYGQAEVIHAQFNALGDVLTQQKPGYVKVDFAIDGEGGKIKQGETTTYYVNPSKDVTLKAPITEAQVGYEFKTWTPNPTKPTQYKTDTTIQGTFKALPDIIPNVDENGKPNLQPNGYIPVEFKPGDHGTLEGTTLYWVKPGVEVTVPAPTPKANTNYAFTSWDKSLTLTATAGQAPITITAQWKSTYTPTPNPNKPDPNKPDPNQPDPNQPDPNKPGTTPSGDVSVDGKARQDVAANISKTYFPNAKKVIVVQNKAYADSMSAMNISQGNIPILYTGRDTLFSVTMREILRVPREEIIVMGGENSVSNKVFRELQGLSSAKVTRIGGADRFEVNRNSAKYMPNSTTAVIASGMIYTDALSSVPYAHALHAPILLVSKNSVPQAVKDVLYDRMTSAVIVGGQSTVSQATKSQLEKIIGTSIERIGGANRYVVSAAIASRLQNVQHAIITSGELWSDALVAGPMAQRLNAPVLLTPYGGLREGAYNYLLAHPDLKSVITVGGRRSIGQGVHNQVKAIFGSNKQWNLDPEQVVNQ